jgi:hypothetical protein
MHGDKRAVATEFAINKSLGNHLLGVPSFAYVNLNWEDRDCTFRAADPYSLGLEYYNDCLDPKGYVFGFHVILSGSIVG